ncbi:MAG: hypothetical protein ABF760_05465 [Zymomonas mobilis]
MIVTRHFRAICLVGLCCIAALICYMITQRVSLERRALLRTEREIVNLRQSIRHLQTEKDTLARSDQIDRWNAEAFALVSPTISQFVSEDAQLAMQDNVGDVPAASHNEDAAFRQASYMVPTRREPSSAAYNAAATRKVEATHSVAASETTLAPPAATQASARIFSSDVMKSENSAD